MEMTMEMTNKVKDKLEGALKEVCLDSIRNLIKSATQDRLWGIMEKTPTGIYGKYANVGMQQNELKPIMLEIPIPYTLFHYIETDKKGWVDMLIYAIDQAILDGRDALDNWVLKSLLEYQRHTIKDFDFKRDVKLHYMNDWLYFTDSHGNIVYNRGHFHFIRIVMYGAILVGEDR